MIKQIKGRWKRAVSSLMALVIAAGLLPGSAFAAEPPDPVHKETAYAPTGSFELNVAGATAWAGGEDALTVYATESGTRRMDRGRPGGYRLGGQGGCPGQSA